MLYWNPEAPETQFFFNDRDPETGRVFCVLFDIARGENGRRVKEYRFPDVSIGNSGVAQRGGSFLGLNYGRLSRLRPVTGYPDAHDWTRGVNHPTDDGLFRVNVHTGAKQLLVSYRRIADQLRDTHPAIDGQALFLNHTLWNRDDDRIFFYARADFEAEKSKRLDALFVVNPDGSGLRLLPVHLGGHLEWESGHRLIGLRGDRIALYDTDRLEFVADLGTPALLGDANGDKALAPGGDWLVNGFRVGRLNTYALLRRSDLTCLRSRGFDQHGWLGGPLRVDPAPCWNRDGTQILFSSIAEDAAGNAPAFHDHAGRNRPRHGPGRHPHPLRSEPRASPGGAGRGSRSFRGKQELAQEEDLGVLRIHAVLPPVEAVPFAAEPDVPYRHAVAPDRGDDPLRLLNLDARIVLAVDDQKRPPDLLGVLQRRDGAKELPCLRIALIAELGPPARDRAVKGIARGRSRGWRYPRYRSPPGADGCSASGRQGPCSRRRSRP